MGRPRRQRRRAQGLTEYVIVVGLIAVVLVGAVRALGGALARAYGHATSAVERVGDDLAGGGPAPDGHPPPAPPARSSRDAPCEHGAFVHDGLCLRCGERVAGR